MRKIFFAVLAAALLAEGAKAADEPAIRATVQAVRSSHVNAEVVGIVAEILVEEGQRVEEGDVLCRLAASVQQANYDLAVMQAGNRAALKSAEVRLEQAKRDLERATTLTQRGTDSQVDLERAEYNFEVSRIQVEAQRQELEQLRLIAELRKATLDEYTVRAPFSGIVAKKYIELGETTYPLDKRLFHLIDTSKVYIEAHPHIARRAELRHGMRVEVKTAACDETVFEGDVTFIAPVADVGGRSFGIRAVVDNSDGALIPGMNAELYVLPVQTAQAETME